MRRLIVIAAGVLATLAVSAVPVLADGDDVQNSAGLVSQGLNAVERTVNPFLQGVPTPSGWHDRDACLILYPVDRSVCVYFPFPI